MIGVRIGDWELDEINRRDVSLRREFTPGADDQRPKADLSLRLTVKELQDLQAAINAYCDLWERHA